MRIPSRLLVLFLGLILFPWPVDSSGAEVGGRGGCPGRFTPREGRLHGRHCRLHQGDQVRSEVCHSLLRPRPGVRPQRRLRQGHRRSQ